jgi:hypothetical protein
MLLSLHFAVLSQANEGPYSRIWLLVHFGLFLIWQPFVSAERELNVIAVALLLGVTAVHTRGLDVCGLDRDSYCHHGR